MAKKNTSAITIHNVEEALSALEARHARHQKLHEDHRERKARARELHHRPVWLKRSVPPITLV